MIGGVSVQEYRRESPYKIGIEVIACHHYDGTLEPIKFITAAMDVGVRVDKMLDARRGASLKAGGHGMRYRCRVGKHEITLWHDGQFWFMETEDFATIYAQEE